MGAPATSVLVGTALGAGVVASGGTLLPALAAAGIGMSVVGGLFEAQAQKDQADYAAEVAEQNAIRSKNAADEARIRGEITEQQHRFRVNQAIGQARTAAASRGVLVDTGSALDLTSAIGTAGELDAQTIRRDSFMEQQTQLDRGRQFRSEADLERRAGENARNAGIINAGSTALTGGALVAEKWYNFGGSS